VYLSCTSWFTLSSSADKAVNIYDSEVCMVHFDVPYSCDHLSDHENMHPVL